MQPSSASSDASPLDSAVLVVSAGTPPTSSASTSIGVVMAISAAIMWGTNGVIASFLLGQGITPLTLVEARSIIAAVGMGVLLLCVAQWEVSCAAARHPAAAALWAGAGGCHLLLFPGRQVSAGCHCGDNSVYTGRH